MYFWLYHTAHCAEKIVCTLAHGFCINKKCGTGGGGWGHLQGDMHTVAARLGCQRAMLGIRWVNSHPGYMDSLRENTILSSCRVLISGKEGCLDSECVYGNQEC